MTMFVYSYEVYEMLIAAYKWKIQADAMLARVSGSLLSQDDLRDFNKRGETLVVMGEGLGVATVTENIITTQSIGSSSSSALVPSATVTSSSSSSSSSSSAVPPDEAAQAADVVVMKIEQGGEGEEETKEEVAAITSNEKSYTINDQGFTASLMRLKTDYRDSKAWLTRLNERTGQVSSSATTSLDALLLEADQLAVDLTEHTEPVQQVTKCYCFCRLGYHGEMIGCDQCSEW